MMRSICCWILSIAAIVMVSRVMLFSASEQTDMPSTSKVVLRLPYRGRSNNSLSNPYTIGMFHASTHFGCADFMGTDWEGNIYILDPLTSESSVLKRFDKNGQFQEVWKPVDAQRGDGVAVTQDGYIWAGLESFLSDHPGLPLVAYRKGIESPVIDWRNKPPKEVNDKIRAAFKEKGLEWKQGWFVSILEGGAKQVYARLTGQAIGQEGRIARVLHLWISSDGSRILGANIKLGKGEMPHLAPDGQVWMRESDFNAERWTWSKVWLWKIGEEKGAPLIDRTINQEPWGDKVTLGKARPPIIKLDAKGHIYLMWAREDSEPHKRRFMVEGKIISDDFPPPPFEGERALIVLDSSKGLMSYLPWIPNSVEIQDRWVKPLPDGSGFYRIQFLEKEAVVYFHPLPQ